MKVLMHYTIQRIVYNKFSKVGSFSFQNKERINHVSDFYKKYNRNQTNLFFIVCYHDMVNSEIKYTACKVNYNEVTSKYEFTTVSKNMCEIICAELGLNSSNTYDGETYYRILTIEDIEKKFMNNNREYDLNKIKLKFFSWNELLLSSDILFNEITNKIFNDENVLKIASTYKPKLQYTSKQLKQKYFNALKAIGFISKDGIDVSFTTLQGDIGEFVMHIMLSEFICEQSSEKYIYPKLVFKSSPKMPVYGNDGTIYLKDKKAVYYLEAKFYSDLNKAINKAVSSLREHNEVSQENLNHKIELFRNIETDELDEIIEIDENTSENLVIFLICDSDTNYEDILKKVRENNNLNSLKKNFSIVLFVLPILSKKDFLKFFQNRSKKVWEELNEE